MEEVKEEQSKVIDREGKKRERNGWSEVDGEWSKGERKPPDQKNE